MRHYFLLLNGRIPDEWYVIAMIVFVAGSILSFVCFGIKRGIHYSLLLLFIEYVFLLYGMALLCRNAMKVRKFSFVPFWSYRPVMEGNRWILAQIIINVVMFIPVGFLLGFMSRSIKWWHVSLAGFGISASIEILQFITCRGFSEFDDLFHNSLGCLIGFMLYNLVVGEKWGSLGELPNNNCP